MDLDPIQAAITAIETRRPGESFLYRKIAQQFGIARTTLMRRYYYAIDNQQTPYDTRVKIYL